MPHPVRRRPGLQQALQLPSAFMRRIGAVRPGPHCHRPRRWTQWLGRNWARVTFGRHIEPTWLELTHHQIRIPDLPPEFDGYRIVQLSDLHASHRVPSAYLWEAVDLANRQAPDLIALTGDFIHAGFRHVDRVSTIVGRLAAPQGIFAVLGNHDYSVRNVMGYRRHPELHAAVASGLQRHGIQVLRNESVTIRRGDSSLYLVGVEDLWSRECNVPQAFGGLSPAVPRVLLAHNPHTVSQLAEHRCDLVLSGHTHGGQVDWPGLGRFFLSRKGKQFAAGMYQHGDARLYVNRGVGFGMRFRFNVRPEVAVFELHRSPPAKLQL